MRRPPRSPPFPFTTSCRSVVPMVPPTWNDAARVEEYAERLQASSTPTAVAVSTLDVCAPAVDHGTDYYAHWGLTHFLLDGQDRKSTRLNSSHANISYAVFC